MDFFTSGLFWFLEGVLACLAVIGIKLWMEDRGIPMPWWKWVVTALWICLVGFTLAMVGTSLGEGEHRAALMGGIIFGVLSVITGVVVWRLLQYSGSSETTTHEA